MDSEHPAPFLSFDPWQQRLIFLACAGTLIGLSLSAAILTLDYLIRSHVPAQVLGTIEAGKVLRVQLQDGWSGRSLVETDRGFYALTDISLAKGETVTVQERDDRQRYLCASAGRCTRLVRPVQ